MKSCKTQSRSRQSGATTNRVIGTGKLDHRINISRKDEIGELATNFNQMTEKLQESQLEMKSLYENLEEYSPLSAQSYRRT